VKLNRPCSCAHLKKKYYYGLAEKIYFPLAGLRCHLVVRDLAPTTTRNNRKSPQGGHHSCFKLQRFPSPSGKAAGATLGLQDRREDGQGPVENRLCLKAPSQAPSL